MEFKTYMDEELLSILRKYNDEVGFPTQRKFRRSNGLPSYCTYFTRFGSFKNAIELSGINIPENKLKYFNREKLDDEELLRLLRLECIKKIKSFDFPIKNKYGLKTFVLTEDEINDNNSLSSMAAYVTRFGGINEVYKLCGINTQLLDGILFKKDMKLKFLEMYKTLGKLPTSRDITRISNGSDYYYSTGSFCYQFGSMMNLYKACGFEQLDARNMTKEEGLGLLHDLYFVEGIIPTHVSMKLTNWIPSNAWYNKRFDSFIHACIVAGIPKEVLNDKSYITTKNTVCLSYYEYVFCKQLEDFGIEFDKEVMYKDHIQGFDKKYRFDFLINDNIFVEIFGITGNEFYDEKVKEKVELCKDNNIKLISLFPKDMMKLIRKEITILDILNLKGE